MGLFDDPIGAIGDFVEEYGGDIVEKVVEIGGQYVQGELKARQQKAQQRQAEKEARRAARRGGGTMAIQPAGIVPRGEPGTGPPIGSLPGDWGPMSGGPETWDTPLGPWMPEWWQTANLPERRSPEGWKPFPHIPEGWQWGGQWKTGGFIEEGWGDPTAGEVLPPQGGTMPTDVGYPVMTLPSGQPWTIKNGRMCLIRPRPQTIECRKARMIATPAGPLLVPARRRMNPLNFRAAGRAMRRLYAAERMSRRFFSFTRRKTIKRGRFKRKSR